MRTGVCSDADWNGIQINLKLTLQPNAGIKLEQLLGLIKEHGKYVYLINGNGYFQKKEFK